MTDVLAELATADVERVREILAEEKDGPNRPAILDTCQAVLDKIGVAERKPGRSTRSSRAESCRARPTRI